LPEFSRQHRFSQHPYRCRLDWGARGAHDAAERGDVVVIVDTLRFSTAVATAVSRGAFVHPCAYDDDADALARRVGAEIAAGPSEDGPRYSLSPGSLAGLEAGTQLVLPSLNGGLCSIEARGAARVFAGALVNAGAVAAVVGRVLAVDPALSVTVIACGERWGGAADGELCVAVEDYLGAGAILSKLSHDKSPEAQVCEAAFAGSRERLLDLLLESGSGRELRSEGLEGDVRFAARLDVFDEVPALIGGRYEREPGP